MIKKLLGALLAFMLLVAGALVAPLVVMMVLSPFRGGYCGGLGDIRSPGAVTPVTADKLADEQAKNAALIIAIGKARGLPGRDIQIALMTSMQESELRNISYGDRDSLGLYQQRPSQGWGTADQILDPVYAINKFYATLERIDGRQNLSLMEVALRVQRPSLAAYTSPTHNFMMWNGIALELLQESETKIPGESAISVSTPAPVILYDAACADKQDFAETAPSASAEGWTSPMASLGAVTSPFGWRIHPILRTRRMHTGADFGAKTGEPYRAMNNGVVTTADYNAAFGNRIIIDYGGGMSSMYAHMNAPAKFSKGDQVKSGEVVGYAGTSGWSTGTHMHLEWYVNGEPVDPVPKLCERGIAVAGASGCTVAGS